MLSAYHSAEVALRGTTKVKLSGHVAESTHRRMSNGDAQMYGAKSLGLLD